MNASGKNIVHNKYRTPYVRYNIQFEVDALDQNTVNANDVSVFPRGIYSAEVFPEPQYLCSYPRDKSTEYILGVERDSHPDHFSRFMYGNNWNGYGVGHFPGFYRVSEDCCGSCPTNVDGKCANICDLNPKGTAPAKFYNRQCNTSGCV